MTTTRRQFLHDLALSYLALTVGCSSAWAQSAWTGGQALNPGKPGQVKPPAPGSMRNGLSGQIGCYLSAVDAGNANLPALSVTTGIPALDQGLTSEWFIINRMYGVKPALYMYDDSTGSNAFATPSNFGPRPQVDGSVCFGRQLMVDEFQSAGPMGRGDHVLMAILAHEWAHILQYKKLTQFPPGKPMELCADEIAGWYMGTRSTQLHGEVDLSSSIRSFFNKGDLAINSPRHHGTSQERYDAFQRGVSMADSITSIDDVFTAARGHAGL